MPGKIRVLIADDHTLFRSGVRSLLQRQEDFDVVDEARDGLEAVKRAKLLRPDVVLLDLRMPGISGTEAVKLIVEEVPGSNILVLTVSEDADDLVDTLRAGATGYLVKNIDTDALIDAIRRAAKGEAVVSPQMTAKLVQGLRRPQPTATPTLAAQQRLSAREREILRCLTRGESNKEIARTLELAESTIKIHLQNIFKKLNMTSRVQAALYAVEHGFGDADSD